MSHVESLVRQVWPRIFLQALPVSVKYHSSVSNPRSEGLGYLTPRVKATKHFHYPVVQATQSFQAPLFSCRKKHGSF